MVPPAHVNQNCYTRDCCCSHPCNKQHCYLQAWHDNLSLSAWLAAAVHDRLDRCQPVSGTALQQHLTVISTYCTTGSAHFTNGLLLWLDCRSGTLFQTISQHLVATLTVSGIHWRRFGVHDVRTFGALRGCIAMMYYRNWYLHYTDTVLQQLSKPLPFTFRHISSQRPHTPQPSFLCSTNMSKGWNQPLQYCGAP